MGRSIPIRNVEEDQEVKGISIRTNTFVLASVLFVSLGLTPNAWGQQPLLPNLTATPAFDISVNPNSGNPELRFAFRSWNSGVGPMELIAGELSQGRQNVYQRIYNEDGSYADSLAGNFEWHQGHSHFHFDDYALYVLPALKGKSQRTSAKTSFCLMDTDLMDGTLPGAPSTAEYANCGNSFQGISVGWGDKYGAHLPGQEIPLRNMKDGDYRLITQVDPQNRILETNENDNEACVLIRIFVSAATVEVLNDSSCDDGTEPPPPPGGDVTVDSIAPGSAGRGSSVSVVISGSGFATGMDVRLENGSGSRPTISNIDISATTITAMITVKNGAKAGSWDVRVGSGVLIDGFTVSVP